MIKPNKNKYSSDYSIVCLKGETGHEMGNYIYEL